MIVTAPNPRLSPNPSAARHEHGIDRTKSTSGKRHILLRLLALTSCTFCQRRLLIFQTLEDHDLSKWQNRCIVIRLAIQMVVHVFMLTSILSGEDITF